MSVIPGVSVGERLLDGLVGPGGGHLVPLLPLDLDAFSDEKDRKKQKNKKIDRRRKQIYMVRQKDMYKQTQLSQKQAQYIKADMKKAREREKKTCRDRKIDIEKEK